VVGHLTDASAFFCDGYSLAAFRRLAFLKSFPVCSEGEKVRFEVVQAVVLRWA
jgi:hypothetical protein